MVNLWANPSSVPKWAPTWPNWGPYGMLLGKGPGIKSDWEITVGKRHSVRCLNENTLKTVDLSRHMYMLSVIL